MTAEAPLPRIRVPHPHVRCDATVLGGSPHVVGSRVPVRRLWLWHRGGAWTPKYEDIENSGRRDAKLSTIFYVAGGAAVAGGVILYFLGANEDAAAGERVSVAPLASGTGLVVSWAY